MAISLQLAGNLINFTEILGGAGHLQVVLKTDDGSTEIEVQSPDFFGLTGGDWVYFLRDHAQTPFFGDATRYAAVDLLTGDAALAAWNILLQAHEQMVAFSPNFEYNLLSQNSNSYANTILSVIGIDLDDVISGATPSVLDSSSLGFPGENLNVLTSNAIDVSNPGSFTRDLVLGGNLGDDRIATGAGNDEVFGFAGNDTISTGAGNDVIQGGAGNDSINGGGGSEDLIDYSDQTSGMTIDLGAGQATGGGQTDSLAGLEFVVGTNSADTITGNGADNYLFGFGGNDSLAGAAGNDSLDGGAGTDTLNGGAGDDVLDAGGVGTGDRYIGGAGEDSFFIFSGTYVVEDFTAGEDFFLVGGASTPNFGGVTVSQAGSDVLLTWDTTQVTLENTNTGDISADQFLFF